MDSRLPSASVWAVHWAAPALKVTFTGTPGDGPDFARGVRGRAVTADTRAQDRGDTCAHTRFGFRVRRRRRRIGIGGPTPLRAPVWGALGAGDADTCGPASFWSFLDVPVRQSCSPMSEVQFGAAQTWDCGKSASWGLYVL